MSEFFLELFSEEIPPSLQQNLRKDLLEKFKKLFAENFISFKNGSSFSTPNRAVIVFTGVQKKILVKSEEIKGPNLNVPNVALEGFIRSNKISKNDLYKKKIEKGEFYFFRTKPKVLKTHDLLEEFIPIILKKIQWKKSMKWADFDLSWGRPLKSILAVFDKKKITFKFHHIISSNLTFIDKEFEEKRKVFTSFRTYEGFFYKQGVIIDQNKRENKIRKEFEKIFIKKNLKIRDNDKLLKEVINLIDNPNVLECVFDKKYLNIPEEILVLTMQSHQKYFPLFSKKDEITNEFLVVANNHDQQGLIKIGNERVVTARLNDAEFFWNKDKSQNLVKKVSDLKSMNLFKNLGNYFDKVQRMRKLGALISDELLISKEKVELSASICKTDLLSESVREFPELQGIMGGHLSNAQGFDKEITYAIKEQYLPIGLDSTLPKKPFNIALSITDKIDTLVGFFGVNEKPSSSKDPYALRRLALGIIRMIVENKKKLKLNDLILYSAKLFNDQGINLSNKTAHKDVTLFLKDRFKYYLKEKNIRHDIIEASINIFDLNKIYLLYQKSKSLNKVINKKIGEDIVSSYKRASNILQSTTNDLSNNFSNMADPSIFKDEFEKNLHKKINELKKHFSEISKEENFDESLLLLSSAKKEIFDFFDNVKVNDDNEYVRKNRLELINILCKTFENFIDFHLIKDINE